MNRMNFVLTAAAVAEGEVTTIGQRIITAAPSIVLMAVVAVVLVISWNRQKK